MRIRRLALVIGSIAVLAAASSAVADETAVPLADDANALYATLRANLGAQIAPAYLSYSIAVTMQSDRSVRVGHYDGELAVATGTFRVHQFSHEEDDHPAAPHGVNVLIKLKGRDPIVVTKYLADQPIGVPNLSPLYSFGLRACAGRPAVTDASPADGLKAIGSVTTVSRTYRVTLAGSEPVNGVTATHLTLAPLADPAKNRLRDLWVDEQGTLLQARVAQNFTSKALESVPWLVEFTTTGGLTSIARETAEQPIRIGRETYAGVTIAFSNIAADHKTISLLAFALPQFGDPDNGFMEPVSAGAC